MPQWQLHNKIKSSHLANTGFLMHSLSMCTSPCREIWSIFSLWLIKTICIEVCILSTVNILIIVKVVIWLAMWQVWHFFSISVNIEYLDHQHDPARFNRRFFSSNVVHMLLWDYNDGGNMAMLKKVARAQTICNKQIQYNHSTWRAC